MANDGEHIFKLHKLDDKQAYDLVESIRLRLKGAGHVLLLPVHGFDYTLSAYGADRLVSGTYSLRDVRWSGQYPGNAQTVTVYFSRYNPKNDEALSPYFDYLRVIFSGGKNSWQEHADVVFDVLNLISSSDTPTSHLDTGEAPDVLRELILSNNATHRGMMEELSKSVSSMIEKRAELEEQALAAESEREQAHKAAIDALDAERKKLQLQSHMSERRGLSKSIKDLMQSDRFTTGRRQSAVFAVLVFIAYFGIGVAGGMGTYLTFQAMNDIDLSVVEASKVTSTTENVSPGATAEQPSATPQGSDWTSGSVDNAIAVQNDPMLRWFLIVKFVLSTLITLAGFTAAAAWMKRYYDEEMRLSREMIAFVADVERASWVIEAIHEVKHEAKGELPKEWIDAVTRNLFSGVQHNAQLDDNALALRALMGIAGSAKVGPNGLEVDIGRKGAKALGEAG